MIRKKKLKICQLCAVDFTLLKFLLPLVDAQTKIGHTVINVCSHGENIDALRKNGYKVKTLNIERSLNPIKFLISAFQLFVFLRKEKFDIIHVHTPVAALIGRLAAKAAKVPNIIYTAHGFYFHDEMPKIQRLLHISLERIAGHFTSLLFTQSLEDAQTAQKLNIALPNRIFAIGNGVNKKKFSPKIINKKNIVRANFKIPKDAFVIGMICRLVKEKGIIEFLDAAKLIKKNYSNVWFILVGDRLKSDRDKLVNKSIKDANVILNNQLILTGMRNDIPEILSCMDLFSLPSRREGMPRTIIEAMMMEKPVVATNIRGSREEVINEKTGLLVPTKNPKKLAEAFEKIIKNPNLGKSMGLAGRKRALKHYDESKVIDLQLRLIEQYLNK